MKTAAASVPRLRPRVVARWQPGRRGLITATSIVVVMAVWQLMSALAIIDARYISSPTGIAAAGWEMLLSGELWTNGGGSLYAFAVGFALSIAVGVPAGLAMGWNRTLRQLAEPPMMALYATPRLALLPVIVVWLGIGAVSTVAVVFIGAVLPIVVNGMAGIREVDAKLIQVARSFGISRFDLFRKVLLPASVPAVLTGIQLGVGRAVLGVVVSEMYVATGGIGQLVTVYGQSYRTDHIVFLVVLVAAFGYLVSAIIRQLEVRVERWRQT